MPGWEIPVSVSECVHGESDLEIAGGGAGV